MANTKDKAEIYDPEGLVEVELFDDGYRNTGDVFVCVNGESIRLKRGRPVKIKRKFAEALEHSMAQKSAAARTAREEARN